MAKEQLVRQWEIVSLLNGSKRGLRSTELAQRLECSPASINRALEVLRQAGVPLERENLNGEVRHRLSTKPLPPLAPTPLQLSALQLALAALSGLEGTKVVEEIRCLLRQDSATTMPQHLRLRVPKGRREIVRTLESAIEHRCRVRMVYRATAKQGGQETYEVSPVALRLVKEHLYLVGFCERKPEPRVFKILRVVSAEYLKKPAERRKSFELESWFRTSIKAWGGASTAVEVSLRPEVAWLAEEYPIVENQTVEIEASGAARIRAEVSGLVEAKQWVLGWGKSAVALSPPELVQAVQEELRAALASYPELPSSLRTESAKATRPSTRAAEVSRALTG